MSKEIEVIDGYTAWKMDKRHRRRGSHYRSLGVW
jgi:hypothetical protein